MPNPRSQPRSRHRSSTSRDGGYQQTVSQPYEPGCGDAQSDFPAHATTISGPLVPAHGQHIFFDGEHDHAPPEKRQSVSSGSFDGALQVSRPEMAQLGRSSSIATPSATSSSTTMVGSTASSVTLSDCSDWEYAQRRTRSMDSSRMDKVQMLSDFLEMHFPTPAAKADLAERRSYLMGLPEVDLSSAPMLRSAVEAICYAHAGANYGDQRLVQAAQRSYGKVLTSLVRSLNSDGKQNDPQVIIPSIMLLTMYDDSLPEANATGWRAHYWGVHEYLRAMGPPAFSLSDSFSRMLFLNLRVPTMFLGIARRKAVVLGEPKWRALGNMTGLGASPLGRLYPRALQLPALLEKTDIFLRKNNYTDAKQLMRELMTLRGELLTWSMTESSFADRTFKYSKAVDVSDDSIFDFDIEEHLVMSANTSFDSLFDFNSFKIAQDYALYWIFALILDCTLLRVMHFRPDTEAYIRPRTRVETERDAMGRAQHLCRGTYFFSKFGSQGIAAFSDAQLALAESFFTEIGAAKELGWCQSVRVAVQMRLRRIREKQPKTLCRMGDMVGDLALATRYKTRHIAADI